MAEMRAILDLTGFTSVTLAAFSVLIPSSICGPNGSIRIPRLMWPCILFMCANFLASFTGCATQPPPPQPIILTQPQPPVMKPLPPPIPQDPRVGLSPAVLQAIADPQHPTVKQGIAVIYPYSEDAEYKLTCTPLRATEIRLNHDETFEQAALGDTTRWSVQGADHTALIKALGDASDPKMATNLIISTTKRSYHITLRLGHFQQAVAWYYVDDFQIALNAYNTAVKGK